MPISYTIHSDHRLVVTRFTGYVGDDEFRQARESILNDPDCKPGFDELADLTELEDSDVTSDSMRSAAVETKQFDETCTTKPKLAVVVATGLQFGLSRMYGAYADIEKAETVRQFYDAQEALEWLDAADIPVDSLHGDPRPDT